MKKCLVLGSSGFIGSHLVKSLLDDNCIVYGSDIRDNIHETMKPTKFILGDLRDPVFVENLFKLEEHFDEVYQLAADMGGALYINCGENDGSVMSNSVTINSNVAKNSVKYKVGKLFFSSSACVYPHNDKDVATCNEEDAYPAKPDNEYGWEKLFSERMYKNYEKQFGLKVFIARFHSIVGDYSVFSGERAKAHSALAYKVVLNKENEYIEVIGDGKQIRTFLYVKDCVKAIRLLMNSDSSEVMNIGSDECVTINEYIEILKKISGKNFNIKYIEGPTGVKFRYCNIEKAKKQLNWKPETSLYTASELTYNYIINEINKRINVLFVSQTIGYSDKINSSYCGIGLRGKLTSDILSRKYSKKYNFIPILIDSYQELEKFILLYRPKVIIYNYHSYTTKWIDDSSLRNKYSDIKHVMIHYDLLQRHIDNMNDSIYKGFKYVITDNENIKVDNKSSFLVTRSVPFSDQIKIEENRKDNIPIIGFQGFGVPHKGIYRIAYKIQEEFDEAIFRLHIPFSYYGDPNGQQAFERINEVRNVIKKPGIKIEASHNFLSDEEIVKWLNKNTINCYFFDYLENSGISSSTDYAVASLRPICINNSRMFVNLHNLNPPIEIEKLSLREVINNGVKPLLPIYEKYKNENVVRDYEKLCDMILN